LLFAIPLMAQSFVQEGLASWYGPGFHGKATSNGERFDKEAFTAAHKTLPFGSMVKVSNLANGKSVTVRVNDRGPFVEGRIIDLSEAAARAIGMIGTGTARVRLAASLPAATTGWAVQAASFAERAKAEALAARLKAAGYECSILVADLGAAGLRYRVRLHAADATALAAIKRGLKAMGLGEPLVRKL